MNDRPPEVHPVPFAGQMWAIVLAGGDGTRVADMSRDASGQPVPKQYSTFGSDEMLLHAALRRVAAVVPPSRTLVVVAEKHRGFWHGALSALPRENVVVQPRNRGTAAGILLPAAEVLRRDGEARVLLMPADHHVEDDEVLISSLQAAVAAVLGPEHRLLMLGMAAEEADHEYGWIVPGSRTGDRLRSVKAFVEKPGADVSRALADSGALVNSFILAVRGTTLMTMYDVALPDLMQAFTPAIGRPLATRELSQLYDRLPANDFSRDVLEPCADSLRVLAVPPCGWSDLGTPRRLQRFLGRGSRGRDVSMASVAAIGGQP